MIEEALKQKLKDEANVIMFAAKSLSNPVTENSLTVTCLRHLVEKVELLELTSFLNLQLEPSVITSIEDSELSLLALYTDNIQFIKEMHRRDLLKNFDFKKYTYLPVTARNLLKVKQSIQ